MFSGRYDHSIDDKGRVSIPARFRDALQAAGHDRLFVTNFIDSGHPCLDLLPPNEWNALLDKVRGKARFDPDMRDFELFYIGGAHEAETDRQGRILIPPKLREFARLDREVTFNARTDHFQLWDKALLEQALKAAQEKFLKPEFFQKINF